MTLSTLEGSASGCAAPSWPMAAPGQQGSQVSSDARKPSQAFVDVLALFFELLEFLVKPRLRIHPRRLSDEPSGSNPRGVFVPSC
jgi:hypothetical protein